MNNWFEYDKRLGISLPSLEKEWSQHTIKEQEAILHEWERIRGKIPDRIFEIEQEIEQKQSSLNRESNFEKSCHLNSQISELASKINDLWIWYRSGEEINTKVHAL